MDYLPILSDIKKRLKTECPGLIDRVILYGSRSNGTETRDSDLDILVVLNKDFDWQLKDKIYDICYEADLAYGLVSDIRVASKSELEGMRGKQPYIIDALHKGIAV